MSRILRDRIEKEAHPERRKEEQAGGMFGKDQVVLFACSVGHSKEETGNKMHTVDSQSYIMLKLEESSVTLCSSSCFYRCGK